MILERYRLVLKHETIVKVENQETMIMRDDPLVATFMCAPEASPQFGELYILEVMTGKLKDALLKKLFEEGEKNE